MTGRRRLGMKPATAPVTVVATETPHADTQVIEPAPEVTEVITLDAAEPVTPEEIGSWADYIREPVPDLDSPDPADRTAYLDAIGGTEPAFRATVAELDAMYLLDTSLPVPVRPAPEAAEDTKDSGPAPDEIPGSGPAGPDANPVPEAARPPAAEEAGPAAEQASPEASGTVSTEDEPAQDEPVAEPDCGAEA